MKTIKEVENHFGVAKVVYELEHFYITKTNNWYYNTRDGGWVDCYRIVSKETGLAIWDKFDDINSARHCAMLFEHRILDHEKYGTELNFAVYCDYDF